MRSKKGRRSRDGSGCRDTTACNHVLRMSTQDGHVRDLLDRDQRTALSRPKFDDMRPVLVSDSPPDTCLCNRISTSRSFTRCFNWNLMRRTIRRFNEVLVVCVCLLSLLRIPVVMSAPASRHGSAERDRMTSHPKWINPCGSGASDEPEVDLDIVPRLNDDELLTTIVVAAKNALMHAESFKENYVKSTFNVGFQQQHEDWKTLKYSWLPSTDEVLKSLGEEVPIEQLEELELDMALRDTYRYLQKFAVGLEQVVWDQMDSNGQFKNDFADIEFKLRATLCEIQVAMLERNVTPHENISREIMDNELRHMGNSSKRNLRDWVIFRDCMNGLEYVIQVFEYFQRKLKS